MAPQNKVEGLNSNSKTRLEVFSTVCKWENEEEVLSVCYLLAAMQELEPNRTLTDPKTFSRLMAKIDVDWDSENGSIGYVYEHVRRNNKRVKEALTKTLDNESSRIRGELVDESKSFKDHRGANFDELVEMMESVFDRLNEKMNGHTSLPTL
jgi:hypothetical protein